MALTAGVRLAQYEVLSAIGAGGMGEVYRATDTRLNRDVALKTLPELVAADPERIARFRREAQVLASLNHPNVAAIYGFEESAAVRALVMELVDGPTLADRLSQGPIPSEEAIAVAKQIAEAIEYAHEQGVIHRDLKPANIKLTSSGSVKVLDFGLAKALGPADAAQSGSALANSPTLSLAATQAGLILGTAAYMSPEQAKGRPVDRRADIWSFGIVLFEMLSGQTVYSGETVSDTMAAVLMREPDWATLPRTTPARVQELLRRCLVKDPRNRLQAIGEARIALEGALREPASVVIDAAPPPARLSGRTAMLIAGSILLVGLAAAYTGWRLKPEPARPVTRFSLPLQDGQNFTNTGRKVLALSPDGTNLVYVASQKLYLRRLSELEARVIPGSEGGGAKLNPVFSPDGQEVAFQAGEEDVLKRLAISGGAAVTICPASGLYGLEWSEHGLIFGQREKGIMRVSPAGGTPQLLVPIEQGQFASSPHFLPGGRSLLFSVKHAAESWDQGQIVVQPLDGGPRKTVVTGGAGGRYLPSGHLVYALSGVVLAVPFDLSRLEVTGTPVPVVEGIRRAGLIGTSTGLTQFDFSRTGSLVYWPGPMNTVASGTDLALFDRTNKSQPLKLPPRPYRSPRVSPDGKFVALDSEDEREAIVWVYELAGTSAIRQLTFEGKNRAPIWSHDGQWIIFQSEREGGAGMFRQRADGSGTAERLTTSEPNAPHWPQAVSPDGAYLLFSMSSIQRTPTLWTMTLKDRRTEALTGIQAREASFSPNGRGIAYQSPGAGVVLEPFPRTGAKYLVHGVGGHPFWSPDGNEMFINSAPQRSTVIAFNTTPTVKFGRPVEFERVGRLEPNPAVARRNVDMLPNGEFFVGVLTGVTAAADEQQQIRVVLNWFDELRQRVPGR